MGRPGIKFLTDFGPLLIFFIMYFKNDQNLKIAIPPFVIATLISLIIVYLLEKKNTNGTSGKRDTYNFIWWINFIL